MEKVLEERIKRLKLPNDEAKKVIFSIDKGRGRVIATISFPHHKRPCSVYNHLPVQAWEGPDTYDELNKRGVTKFVDLLVKHAYTVYLWVTSPLYRLALA